MYDIENYYNAETIKEAVTLLKEHPDARVISGGSDVLIKIREGKMAGTSLVSIRDIKEIKGIRQMESGDIYIGAGTTFSHVTNDPVIQKLIPVLGEAVDQVGGPQVRNIGTIGGNVCNGAVSADSAPTLFSLNAMLRIADGTGGRMVPIRDFYLGPGKVDLHQGDVLTHIVIPGKDYQGYHGFYIKYSIRSSEKGSGGCKDHLWCSCTRAVSLYEGGRGAEGHENWRGTLPEGGRAGKGRNQSQRFLASF